MNMYLWPGWASYGLVPGERWPGQLLTLSVYLLSAGLLLHYWLWPRLKRYWRRSPAQPAPSNPASSIGASAPAEVNHRLVFKHDQPPEIVIDNTAPPPPTRPGRYNFDWIK